VHAAESLFARARRYRDVAFRTFLGAALCNAVAGVAARFPRRFIWISGQFALLLAAYDGLLVAKPKPPKVIVYASVLMILVASASVVPIRPRATQDARAPQ
jgi:hypothetical protein